jgi:hypothetical protein
MTRNPGYKTSKQTNKYTQGTWSFDEKKTCVLLMIMHHAFMCSRGGMVDTLVSNANAARYAGSSPAESSEMMTISLKKLVQ